MELHFRHLDVSAKKPRTTMDNAIVLKLWKANVGANVILQAMLLEASHPVSSARSSKPETRIGKARRKRVA